jgi:hypothetical protein
MPIVIGNDTISGLGVNGLPANSVTATNLAARAVTATTLASGFVLQTVSDIKTGRIAGSSSFAYSTSALSTTTGSKFLEVSFTPVVSTSLIWIQVFTSQVSETTNHSNNLGHGIWKNNTGAPLNIAYISPRYNDYDLGSVNHTHELTMSYIETAGSTTARTYSWYAGADGGAVCINGVGPDNVWGGQGMSIMIVTEIKQ